MTPRFQITKVNESLHEVGGILSAEIPDKDNECLDYLASKPYFQKWSEEAQKATAALGDDKKSFGNVREQHSRKAVGKFIDLQFDDAKKSIYGVAKIYDDDAWEKVSNGVYTGFSIGGDLVGSPRFDASKGVKFITIAPKETSIVDNPCLEASHFDFVRASGVTEVRKFAVSKSADSFDAIRNRVDAALQEEYLAPAAEDGACVPCCGVWIRDLFPDNVVFTDRDGCLNQCSYTDDGEKVSLGDDTKKVRVEYTLVDKSAKDKGVTTMFDKLSDVEKAAHKSLHEHLGGIKKAATDHCAAMHQQHDEGKAAHTEHCKAVHAAVDGAMKAMGFDPDKEMPGLPGPVIDKTKTTDGGDVAKLVAAITEAIKAAKPADSVIGDPDNPKTPTEKTPAEKAAEAKQRQDHLLNLTKRAQTGDMVAMRELAAATFKKTTREKVLFNVGQTN